jgi:hypothetical protein
MCDAPLIPSIRLSLSSSSRLHVLSGFSLYPLVNSPRHRFRPPSSYSVAAVIRHSPIVLLQPNFPPGRPNSPPSPCRSFTCYPPQCCCSVVLCRWDPSPLPLPTPPCSSRRFHCSPSRSSRGGRRAHVRSEAWHWARCLRGRPAYSAGIMAVHPIRVGGRSSRKGRDPGRPGATGAEATAVRQKMGCAASRTALATAADLRRAGRAGVVRRRTGGGGRGASGDGAVEVLLPVVVARKRNST